MEYYIYKTSKEKEDILNEIYNVRRFIYNDDNISCLDGRIKLIPFSEVQEDRSLITSIKKNYGEVITRFNQGITYYKCYDDRKETAIKFFKESIIFNMMFYNSGDNNSLDFPIFYSYIYSLIESKYLGKSRSDSLSNSLAELGIFAFSTDYNKNINNDLVNAALYNRNSIKDIYEDTMGKNTYDRFSDLCKKFSLELDYPSSMEDNHFYSIIETLKKFFYLRVDNMKHLSLNERNSMIIQFNDEYSKLVNKFEEEKDDFRRQKPIQL